MFIQMQLFHNIATFNAGISASSLAVSGNLSVGGTSVFTGASTFNSTVNINDKLTSTSTLMIATTTDTVLTVKQFGTGDILNLYDGSTEVLTVLDGGNVGIGTTTPDYKLSVVGGMFASTTSNQLTLAYDLADSDYATFLINEDGDLTIDLVD